MLKNTADKKVAAKIPLIKLCTGVFLAGLPAMMSGSFDTRALSRYEAGCGTRRSTSCSELVQDEFFFLHGQEFLSLSLVIPIIIRRTSGSTTRR